MAAVAADAAVLAAVSVAAAPLSIIAAPFIALHLHGQRLDRRWIGAILTGSAAAVASVAAIFGIASLSGLLRPDGEAGGIMLLAIGGTLLGAVFVAVDIDAFRDLAAGRREHVLLDIVRIVATAVMVIGSVVVARIQAGDPFSQIGDVFPFAVLSAVCAGGGTYAAGAIRALLTRSGSVTRPASHA